MSVEIFTRDTFEEVINRLKDGWTRTFSGGEYRYSVAFGRNAKIHVDSSIGGDGFAMRSGENSIRVWGEYHGRPLKKSVRWTTRLPGWEDRLRVRISDICKIINDLDYSPKCPQCGSAMVLRSGVHGKFYGCLRFPKCRGTRNYEEKLPEELEWLKQ